MKTMKKIFALTLAMMMVFSLALSANALDVTVQNAQAGKYYTAYKLLDEHTQTDDGIVYKTTEAWKDFWTQKIIVGESEVDIAQYFTVKTEGTSQIVIPTKDFNESSAAIVAKAAAQYAATKSISPEGTATGAETTSISLTTGEGYYLMTSSTGALCTLAHIEAKDNKLVLREKNTENDLPKINKEVEGLGSDYKVGDIGTFTITVVCEEGKDTYTVHDQMQGLSVEGTISVRVPEGATATVNNPSTVCTKDCSFEVVVDFGDGKSQAYDEIVITYQAKVLETGVESFSNKAWVENVTDTVEETTTKFTLKKTDGEKVLSGAEFYLYVDNGNDKVQIPVVAVKEGQTILYYRPVGDHETIETGETGDKIVAGEVVIKGLEKDVVYYVKEIKAPDGYIPIDDYKQVRNGVVEVVNVKGDELPETGGMGTTVLYIMGGLMVAGAAVLLITKKRMSAM